MHTFHNASLRTLVTSSTCLKYRDRVRSVSIYPNFFFFIYWYLQTGCHSGSFSTISSLSQCLLLLLQHLSYIYLLHGLPPVRLLWIGIVNQSSGRYSPNPSFLHGHTRPPISGVSNLRSYSHSGATSVAPWMYLFSILFNLVQLPQVQSPGSESLTVTV